MSCIKVTKEQINERIKQRGYEMVGEYTGSRDKSEFKCSKDHIWLCRPNDIVRYGCPICANRQRLSTPLINERLRLRGIIMLEEYTTFLAKYTFKCTQEHQWQAFYYNVSMGAGCPTCSGNKKYTKAEVNFKIRPLGLTLIDEYKNANTKARFECDFGHVWNTTTSNIMSRKSGCKICNLIAKERHFTASKISTEWLDSLNIPIREKCIMHENNVYFVDGYDPSTNTVYEFNGTYWHADPRIYTADAVIKKKRTAQNIWDYDKQKHDIIIDQGYNLIIMWEIDYKLFKTT